MWFNSVGIFIEVFSINWFVVFDLRCYEFVGFTGWCCSLVVCKVIVGRLMGLCFEVVFCCVCLCFWLMLGLVGGSGWRTIGVLHWWLLFSWL